MREENTTVDGLISCAKSAGYSVSADQIAEWLRLKLLPGGSRSGRGRGAGRGPRQFPEGTQEQLVALCSIHQTNRDLGEVGWRLWWKGWDVPDQFWRPELLAAAERFDHAIPLIRRCLLKGNSAELSDLAFEVATYFKTVRTKNKLHRNTRKRLSQGNVESFLKFIFRLSIGIPALPETSQVDDSEDQKDERILVTGLGLHRAHIDRLPSGERTLTGSVRQPLDHLAQALRFPGAMVVISSASTELVVEARDELRSVLRILATTGEILEANYGKHAFGLGTARLLDKQQPEDLALLLVIWVSVGKESQLRIDARRFLAQLIGARAIFQSGQL
jgi:hypothetical protein